MAKYKVWKPGDAVLCSPVLSMDTETELIVDHTIPRVVLLQVYDGKDVHLVKWPDIPAYLKEFEAWNASAIFVFHNVAFDIAVLDYPDFLIKAADEGRIVDTMYRFSLFKIAQEGFLAQRSLQHVCKAVLGRDIEKNDEIRLTFTRDKELSKEHLDYAAEDPIDTMDIASALEPQPTEGTQVRGSIALDYISRLGMLVDEGRRSTIESTFGNMIDGHLQILEDNGFIPGKSGNNNVMQEYLEMLEKLYEVNLDRTDKTGKIKTSDAALEELGAVVKTDPFINSYKKYKHLNKMVKTYLRTDVIGSDGRVHTHFNCLVISGRTSSSQPNLQNLPREDGIRGIFIPTPGYYFAAIDYSQLELCTLAQGIIEWYGDSVLADKINSGVDCHKYLASLVFNKNIDSITKDERQFSKIANFGRGLLDLAA